MSETRKLVAILVADVVGYSRLAGADEDRTLSRLRGLRSDLIDPAIAAHHGRIVKRTGDGSIIEFRSVVDAVRCAIEVQTGLIERNAGLPPERRIEFRVGIHVGDVVEESDGDLMGDGVNIAARLESICEPRAICLSEDAYRQVKGRLDLAVTDLGLIQLKNIAEPIRVHSLDVVAPSVTKPATARAPENSAPPRLSIVVLPFANMSGDPDQEYFVDGVTESLTTDLSRIGGSFVIARNTAFTYKGKHVDLKHVGRELNVRYVLEGSIQRGGDRMRVNVQLIDAESGNHLWAERFDKPLADLFDMQDEIVARLANTLGVQLVDAEARWAERTQSPNSMDLTFQGRAWLTKGVTHDNVAEAKRLFERALALDPVNVGALVAVAAADFALALNFLTDDRAARLAAAEAALTRALSLAPENATAHMCLGVIQMNTDRAAEGVRACERALELDRNLANAHALIGTGKLYLGQAEDTEAHVQEALRLSPRDVHVYLWCMSAGLAKLHLGKEEDAVTWLRRSTNTNRSFPNSHFALAAALARLDRLEEAREAARAGLERNPGFTIARFRSQTFSDNPVYLAGRERICEGLRKAGLPEGEKTK
jgi:TolB-like protein/class 3 adenylate cyclase/Flp pilus assembly protein TadD